MESSESTETQITAQRQPRLKSFNRIFSRSILEIKKDSNRRTVTLSNISSNNTVGENSESQHNVKKPLDDRTEAVKPVSCSKVNSKNSRILNGKLYQNSDKSSHSSNKYSDHDYKESSFRSKNHSYNIQDDTRKKYCETHSKSSTVVNTQDEVSQNCIEFKEIKHQRNFLDLNGEMKITLKNDKSKSVPISSNKLPLYSAFCGIPNSQSLSNVENAQIFFPSAEENYIPPPVNCQSVKDSFDASNTDFSSTTSERSEIDSFQNRSLECTVDVVASSDGDETYFSLPDSEQFEAITEYLLTVVKERSVSSDLACRVVSDLNRLFRNYLEGNVIDVYGSYYSDLAISTSDINLVMTADSSVRKSFMYEVYKLLASELDKYHVHPFEEGISAHQSKINFSHPESGINCQLAYLGKYKENRVKMGQFLKRMCFHNVRVKTLIIVTKIWSECLSINEVEDGKLHPVGYALMVIHFLQQCKDPILPVYSCKDQEIGKLPLNNLTIGELWIAFLNYYSVTFNWQRDVITVNSRECVSKKSKGWENYWIAVEDPFTGKNIAESIVNCDIADYIKACFKSSCEYFCNPPENTLLYPTNEEDQSNGDSRNCKWQFSFQQCIAEQSDNFCELCDDLDDICDECKKKIYVQPMSSVPKMTDSFLEIIKNALTAVYKKYMLTDSEVNKRKKFVEELQANVRKIYPDAQLNLFGSSANGFGFKNSDLDICMTFKTKIINTASVLKDVRRLLRKDKNFDQVVVIFNAQIPIIKFRFQPQGWRGDISLDNTLAIHNSDLLYTYSLIDERCKILGCALKLLAKKALIAEVTEKALSSYSYLNMVIHFLQQTDPPVLPVLQDNKFRNDNYKLDHIVENCNVWFCKDLKYIENVFKAENETPVEQLWLDLLDYYCSFDSNQFITIRQKEPQFVDENKHSARLFNIQDPFIVMKNLGCVVSSKKAQETKSIFNRARQLFRTPVKELPSSVKDNEDYFFSTMSLTGRIQKEALCDLCGKYGHEQKECKQPYFPFRRNNFGQFPKQNMYKNRNVTYRKPVKYYRNQL